MNDEVDSVGVTHTDFEQLSGAARSDEHDEIVECQDSGRLAIGVEYVVVVDAVLSCACDDHRIHDINLS